MAYPAAPTSPKPNAATAVKGGKAGDPDFEELVAHPHPTWLANDLRWRRLMDSLIGGDIYVNAVYGNDRRGMPLRNLIRHNREYPDLQSNPNAYSWGATPGVSAASMLGGAEYAVGMAGIGTMGPYPGMRGADPHATAQDDDYEYRRSCTVPPAFVQEAVEIHLGKIYDQEVKRDAPDDMMAWWKDVDGRGTPIDDWMRETVAPLLLVLGNLDVCLDHPKPPEGEKIATRADELRLGLDRCVASYILPQNMLWWRLNPAGRYAACLVREYVDPSDRRDHDEAGKAIDPAGKDKAAQEWRRSYIRYRYWSDKESVLLDHAGETILGRTPHAFGCVPIVRLMDQVAFHEQNVGRSRYEAVAWLQRRYYNVASELAYSNSLQAHPLLSGPEDFCKADQTMSIGPQFLLPMKKDMAGDGSSYQGWEFVSPPKDPAESLRKDLQDLRDAVDRVACLAKPAGAASGTTTAQSGVSKQIDHSTGHKLLRSLTKTLAKAERLLAEFAAIVVRNRPMAEFTQADRDAIKVVYPAKFDLQAAADMLADTIQLQAVLSAAGNAPEIEGGQVKAIVRQMQVDLTDEEYDAYDAEIEGLMAAKATIAEQMRELLPPGISDGSNVEGDGSDEQAAGTDALGQSNATRLSGVTQMGV